VDNATDGRIKAGRRLLRNLLTGLWGFAVALALLLLSMRVQSYLPGWSVMVVLCVFPFPAACGLAVGLVSPRKAIAWAPLWSGVFGLLLIALLSAMVRDEASTSMGRIAWMLAGTLVAAGSGLVGQLASERYCAGKSIFVIIAACFLLAGAGRILLQCQMTAYERDMEPQVLLEVDKDYVFLPRGMEWECRRNLPSGSYVLTSVLNARQIRVFAAPRLAAIDHIEYDRKGRGVRVAGRKAIAQYLRRSGVRDDFFVGLTQDKRGRWESVLRGTRLTVWPSGHLRMDAIPIAMAGVARESGR
jgi:hypothetical protein